MLNISTQIMQQYVKYLKQIMTR